MTTTTQTKRTGFKPVARWPGIAAIAAAALFGVHAANAAAPAATFQIGNVATASYLDPSGTTQVTTSNQVFTTVAQVGSFVLTADGAKSAAAGAVVHVPHVLTNTGNGADTFTITVAENNTNTAPDFTKIEVYLDNGSGLPTGSPLCTTSSAATPCTTTPQSVAGSNGELKFVVSYTVPGTATTGSWPSNAATVTATATTTALYTTASHANTDTVTLTTDAAFSVTKSISTPAVNGPSAWPTPATSGPRGTSTVYTINYTNSGAAAAPLYIKDVLPAGLTYTAGSAVWSSLPGTALTDADDGTQASGAVEYRVVGQTIEAWIQNVNPNVSGTLSFVVSANLTAAIGTSQTSNVAQYNPSICSSTPTSITSAATACTSLSSTNSSAFTVTPSYDVIFGVQDSTNGTPTGTGADLVTVTTAVAGGNAKFAFTLQNNGNATDTFDLSLPSNAFPSGTIFTWLDATGTTPLQDTNGNGVMDSGPVNAGASLTVVLQAQLPGTSAGFTGSTVTARATSAGAVAAGVTTEFDAVAGALTTITGSVADLQNNPSTAVAGDVGPGPASAVTYTVTSANGTVAQFPLQVVNNDTGSLTYNLSASQNSTFPGSMPAGWSVTFSSTACAAPTAITTIAVNGNGTAGQFYACVTIPSSSPATTQPVYFQAQSTTASALTGAIVTDGLHDAVTVTVAATYTFTVTPSNTGSVAPGGTVTFPHNIVNTGNQTCGTGNFTITATPSAAGVAAGWTTALYLDNGTSIGTLDSGDTLITGTTIPAIAVGGSQKILVRVFAGGSSTPGYQETVTVTVTDNTAAPNTCVLTSGNPTDVVTVITGQIRVDKTQIASDCTTFVAPTSGATISRKPGECVTYKVIATNEGAAPVTNVKVDDAIPAGTNYAGTSPLVTQPSTQCVATGLTGTSVTYTTTGTPVTSVSCGSATNSLQPGGTITLQFTVQLNQ